MSTSDETPPPAAAGSGGTAAAAGGSSDTAMLAIGAVLSVATVVLIGIAIWSFSIDHTKRGAAAVIIAVLTLIGAVYVFVRGRKS